MTDATPPATSVVGDITTIKSDIAALNTLWTTAQAQYATRKAALAARVDAYVAAHQGQASLHTAEIEAATAVKATLVPVVAAVETGLSDVQQFVFTASTWSKIKAFVSAHKRPILYAVGVAALGMVYHFA